MAIIGTDEDPNNPNNPSGNIIGGGSGFIGGGSGQGATTTPAQQAQPTSSGHYTNLTQYLKANGDLNGQTGAATTTGQGVENVLNNAANNSTNMQNTFSTSANAALNQAGQGLGVDQNVMGQINSGTQNLDQNKLGGLAAGTQTLANNPGYSGPASAAVNYGGPKDVTGFSGQAGTDYSNALKANTTASDFAGNAGNGVAGGFAGLSNLLKQAYTQPSYTKGENSLDAVLVGGTPGAQQAVQQGATNINNALGGFSTLNDKLNNQIGDYQKQAAATNAAYSGAIQQAQDTSNATQMAYNNAAAQGTPIRVAQAQAAAAKKARQDQMSADVRAHPFGEGDMQSAPGSIPPSVPAARAPLAPMTFDQAQSFQNLMNQLRQGNSVNSVRT